MPVAGCTLSSVPTRRPIARVPKIETPRLVLHLEALQPSGTVNLTILLKPGFADAGWIEFKLGDGVDQAAELRFFLASPYRGGGLMREALRAAAPFALRRLGARAIRAKLPADELSAQAAVRAIGLTESSRRGTMKLFEKELCVLF